jgi:2-dehydropantoate 2-reductase
MRYIVYGAGAVGGGIGARLHQHGHDVILIARGDHLAKIQSQGLVMHAAEGSATLPIPAVSQPSEIDFRDGDVVFLTMKSQDTLPALEDLRAAAGPAIPVITAQNGVANERMAARRFHHVYAMLVMMPASFLTPGEVVLHGTPMSGWLDAGLYPRGTDARIERLCAEISSSAMIARPDANVMRIKYAKLRSNLNNAVDALIGGESRRGPIVARLIEEADACFAAAGIDAATNEELLAGRAAAMTDADIPGHPREGTSSWQSLARGRSIEVDYLNGEVALLGRLHGVPTPYNRAVQHLANEAARLGARPGTTDESSIVALAERYATEVDVAAG